MFIESGGVASVAHEVIFTEIVSLLLGIKESNKEYEDLEEDEEELEDIKAILDDF